MLPYSFCIIKQSYSITVNSIALDLRGCHSLWRLFPEPSARALESSCTTSPHLLPGGIQVALFGFHSCYSPNRKFFLFLRVLSHFSSPRLLTLACVIKAIPGSKPDLRLPWAYRSLPRPSSLLQPSHPLDGL